MKISNFCSTRLALYSSPGSSHSHWYSCVPREGQHVPGLVSYISGHHTRTNHDVWYILLWETSLCVIQHYYVSNSTHSFFYYVCIFLITWVGNFSFTGVSYLNFFFLMKTSEDGPIRSRSRLTEGSSLD